jgi:dihydropteridine reductase
MTGKRVLVYGGCGALGEALVSHMKSRGHWVLSVDVRSSSLADENVVLGLGDSLSEQHAKIDSHLASSTNNKLDAILNVAGGWSGGNAANADFLNSCELMWKQSVWSASISARLAAQHLNAGGLVTLPGAAAALNTAAHGTPSMIGYGMAKCAVHHLTKSLSADAESSGLPAGAHALAIAPVTLDTPMNRKWMPKADFGTWTPLSYIAEYKSIKSIASFFFFFLFVCLFY